jgi:hypothetical protein
MEEKYEAAGDLGIVDILHHRRKSQRRASLMDRAHAVSVLEIGHLLDDIGRGQAREVRILGPADPGRAMAPPTSKHIRLASMRDNFRHLRMVCRVPVDRRKPIDRLREGESRRAVRNMTQRAIVSRQLGARRVHWVCPCRWTFLGRGSGADHHRQGNQ